MSAIRSCTVATFNLHWGRHPRARHSFDVVDACRQLDADVLALQEVWRADGEPSIAERVATELGYNVHETWNARATLDPKCRLVGRSESREGDGDWGQALLTRVPHGPVTEHHLGGFLFDPSERRLVTTDVELEGGTLTVSAAHFPHLEHFSPLLRWRLRGVLPDPHRPALLLGDFNMWRWVSRFVVPGWHDTAKGATWPAPKPVFQIDHLLVTPGVIAERAEVVKVGESDHFPLRAVLRLR